MSEIQPIIQAIPILFITSAVQLMKMLGLQSKYAQLASFILAIFFASLFYFNTSITQTIITILTYGFSAVGLWEVGGKKIVPSDLTPPPSSTSSGIQPGTQSEN